MLRGEDNLLSQLPEEMLSQLLIILASGNATTSFTSLMRTSKENAAVVTKTLRNPAFLFAILAKLPSEQTNQFLATFFSPDSLNYKAIEKSSASGNYYAQICFALLTRDVKRLNWDSINVAINNLKEKNLLPDNIEKSLKLMQHLLSIRDPDPALDLSFIMPLLFKVYANMSGLHWIGSFLSFIIRDHQVDAVKKIIFNFREANFKGGGNILHDIDLNGASLIDADLTDITFPELRGANLRGAIIADFQETKEMVWRGEVDFSLSQISIRSLPIRDQLQNKWSSIVDLKELLQSPDSLKDRLDYLSSINLESDAGEDLRKFVLGRLLDEDNIIAISRLHGEHHAIALLKAASEHPYFTRQQFGFKKVVAGVFGSNAAKTESVIQLEKRIAMLEQKLEEKKEEKETKEMRVKR